MRLGRPFWDKKESQWRPMGSVLLASGRGKGIFIGGRGE